MFKHLLFSHQTHLKNKITVKVIYNELIQFEKSLKVHAQVVNEILFTKALALEREVKKKFFEKAKLN